VRLRALNQAARGAVGYKQPLSACVHHHPRVSRIYDAHEPAPIQGRRACDAVYPVLHGLFSFAPIAIVPRLLLLARLTFSISFFFPADSPLAISPPAGHELSSIRRIQETFFVFYVKKQKKSQTC
jgi:hypothetical protein